jgi:hypothetical protein
MLAAPNLPPAVHEKIAEYIAEKSAGHYGHCPKQRAGFLRGYRSQYGKGSRHRVLDAFSMPCCTRFIAGLFRARVSFDRAPPGRGRNAF